MSDKPFDMPDASHTWEERGGWLVKRLAADFNLQPFQAAGIVGNLGFESVGLTKLREIGQSEGRGGYGWGQWTADRRKTFLAYAMAHGLDWRSDEANYDYLAAEHTSRRDTPHRLSLRRRSPTTPLPNLLPRCRRSSTRTATRRPSG